MLKKYIAKIPATILYLFIMWFALSCIDIMIDNNTTARHSDYNLFKVCMEVLGNDY